MSDLRAFGIGIVLVLMGLIACVLAWLAIGPIAYGVVAGVLALTIFRVLDAGDYSVQRSEEAEGLHKAVLVALVAIVSGAVWPMLALGASSGLLYVFWPLRRRRPIAQDDVDAAGGSF